MEGRLHGDSLDRMMFPDASIIRATTTSRSEIRLVIFNWLLSFGGSGNGRCHTWTVTWNADRKSVV